MISHTYLREQTSNKWLRKIQMKTNKISRIHTKKEHTKRHNKQTKTKNGFFLGLKKHKTKNNSKKSYKKKTKKH